MPRLAMQSLEISLPRVRNEIRQNFESAYRRYEDQDIEKAEISLDQEH
jgi:hypothetical protein